MERKIVLFTVFLFLATSCQKSLDVQKDFICLENPQIKTCWSPICSSLNLQIDVLARYHPICTRYWTFVSKNPIKHISPYREDNFSEAFVVVAEFPTIDTAGMIKDRLDKGKTCDSILGIDELVIVVDEFDNDRETIRLLAAWATNRFSKEGGCR